MMRKRVACICLLLALGMTSTIGCGGESAEEHNRKVMEKAMELGKIKQKVDAGKYEEAAEDLEKEYGKCDYTGYDGENKMIQYRYFYHKQKKYNDEMKVMLDYLNENDFKAKLSGKDLQEKFNIEFAIKMVNKIIDKVSEDNKQKAIDLIGENILNQYKEENANEK